MKKKPTRDETDVIVIDLKEYKRMAQRERRKSSSWWLTRPRPPFGTYLRRWMKSISPRENGFLASMQKIPFDWPGTLFHSLWRVVTPAIIYHVSMVCTLFVDLQLRLFNSPLASYYTLGTPPHAMLLLYALSPWTLGHLHQAAQPLRKLWEVRKSVTQHHSRALPEAWGTLRRAAVEQRLHRTADYDVYLPPTLDGSSDSNDNNNNDNDSNSSATTASPKTAILLVPDRGVEHAAYASPSQLLSNYGYTVVVLAAEPWRTVVPELGYTAEHFENVMEHVQTSTLDGVSFDAWYWVGHAHGCVAVTHVVEQVETTIRGIVLWGAGMYTNDLKDLSQSTIPVGVLEGSSDFLSDDDDSDVSSDDIIDVLPLGTKEHLIHNGTRTGFGSYHLVGSDPLDASPSADDEQELYIDPFEQQQLAAGLTHEVLKDLAF